MKRDEQKRNNLIEIKHSQTKCNNKSNTKVLDWETESEGERAREHDVETNGQFEVCAS